jgi:outer membrane protein TolC
MKKIIVSLAMMMSALLVVAQDEVSGILSSVEQNNTTLKALRKSGEASKLENLTGLNLPDPEVEVGYLWGSPSAIGNRTDISVSQSFDFPTLSGLKRKVAKGQNSLIDLQYDEARISVLLEAKLLCIDIIYYNAVLKTLDERVENARAMEVAKKKSLDNGDCNQLDYNNVALALASLESEVLRVKSERQALLDNLIRLNGSVDISLTQSDFGTINLPSSFDEWYAEASKNNPTLAYARRDIQESNQQLSLSKSMGLPSFSVGYMSEKVVGEHYQGVTVGVSIPLWNNRNRVKQAKAAISAAEMKEQDVSQSLYASLKAQYGRVRSLSELADRYNGIIASSDQLRLLKVALDAGQISVLNYFTEVRLFYNTVDEALAAQRDCHKAYAEMTSSQL